MRYYNQARSIGQAVKTPPSHGGNRGSIPLSTAFKACNNVTGFLFCSPTWITRTSVMSFVFRNSERRRRFLRHALSGSHFSLSYSSGATASSHSLDAPSAGTSTARCWNQLSFAAPCQCFTSGGMFTTSPACSSCAGFPHS